MPHGGNLAALLCAQYTWRLAADLSMPQWLKNVFRKLIATELERAAAALGLGAPDGIKWQTI